MNSDKDFTYNPFELRIFISYSHVDKEKVKAIVEILEKLNVKCLWDKGIDPGAVFNDKIKEFIARSHIFMPIITRNSIESAWVHQETGFAVALDIPILPIAIDAIPAGMIVDRNAIIIEDMNQLNDRLSEKYLEKLAIPPRSSPYGLVVTDSPDDRVKLIAEKANWMIELGEYGKVRSQGRLGHFTIPARPIDDPIWNERDGRMKDRKHLREEMRNERVALEKHAMEKGCKLIIDLESDRFNTTGPGVRKARLIALLEFLEQMPPQNIEIVESPKAQDKSWLIVGNYFSALSMLPRPNGYVQTIFDFHPSEVLRKLRKYDDLFESLKKQHMESKVETVIEKINVILNES